MFLIHTDSMRIIKPRSSITVVESNVEHLLYAEYSILTTSQTIHTVAAIWVIWLKWFEVRRPFHTMHHRGWVPVSRARLVLEKRTSVRQCDSGCRKCSDCPRLRLWAIYTVGSRQWNWKFRENIFKIQIPNFYYIEVIVFDLSYLPVAAVGT